MINSLRLFVLRHVGHILFRKWVDEAFYRLITVKNNIFIKSSQVFSIKIKIETNKFEQIQFRTFYKIIMFEICFI